MTGRDLPKTAAFQQSLRDHRVPYLPYGSTLGSAELEAVAQVIGSGETLSGGAWRPASRRVSAPTPAPRTP